ncbi:hypothetical protein AYI68_g3574, partial [Smittium mucronatum]
MDPLRSSNKSNSWIHKKRLKMGSESYP